jgi:hypothetical protein
MTGPRLRGKLQATYDEFAKTSEELLAVRFGERGPELIRSNTARRRQWAGGR